MAKIAVTEERLLHVEAEPAEAYAFFSQPEKLRAAMVGLERCEISPSGRVRWVLEEKSGQGVRFKANFVVDYAGDGAEHVSWRFVEGIAAQDHRPHSLADECRWRGPWYFHTVTGVELLTSDVSLPDV
jgi:uncharacterized membrane protein